jgi:hypothetical protein
VTLGRGQAWRVDSRPSALPEWIENEIDSLLKSYPKLHGRIEIIYYAGTAKRVNLSVSKEPAPGGDSRCRHTADAIGPASGRADNRQHAH